MSITFTRYFKRESDGDLLEVHSYAESQAAMRLGYKYILRKEYRELKRAKRAVETEEGLVDREI